MTASEARRPGGFSRLIAAEPDEISAVVAGFLLFFLLFASYFMLRPVRETMGVAGGVENLPWMFTGTFLATLVIVPFYGWLSSRVQRRRLLPAAYSFVALTLVGFAAGMIASPADVWLGRAFYIWISVLNLFVFSLGWSLMADIFRPEQAKRLFGQVAAGASLGGLAGPLISGLSVGAVGEPGLLIISAVLMLASLAPVRALLAWRERHGAPATQSDAPDRPIGGNIFAGLTLIVRSPYLLGLSAFVVLLASVNTFLYLEQARLVDLTFADRARQTQAFAAIDVAVQSLTIFIQIFVTGRLTKKLGVTVLLTAVPVLMVAGLGLLAAAATFPVLVGVMVLRRVGEYALVKPGRDMLFTTVDAETKYKAKNVVDTFVYRGGDAISAWVSKAVGGLGMGAALVMIVGAVLAAVWAAIGYGLGRIHDRRAERA
ncbi:NTP/NDP exchange transporter [Phenylobacterium sp.]|uniref:NTP/NDP exchange transporter n=1 Tax=Phenylobacterium sp. TaxID=1871053 RepID=UPI003783065B